MESKRQSMDIKTHAEKQGYVWEGREYRYAYDILLDEAAHKAIKKDSHLQRKYHDVYTQSIKDKALYLISISASLFAAIPQDEFMQLETSKNHHLLLAIEHLDNLRSYIQLNIIDNDSLEKCSLSIEWWTEVMRVCLLQYDINTAVIIYSAITSPAVKKVKLSLSKSTIQSLNRMEYLFSYNNYFENIRDIMINASIPYLGIYKGILTVAKESSNKNYRKEDHALAMNIIKLTTNLHRANKKLMDDSEQDSIAMSLIYHRIAELLQALPIEAHESQQLSIENALFDIANFKLMHHQQHIGQDDRNDKLARAQRILAKNPAPFLLAKDYALNDYINKIRVIREDIHSPSKKPSDAKAKRTLDKILRKLSFLNTLEDKIKFIEDNILLLNKKHTDDKKPKKTARLNRHIVFLLIDLKKILLTMQKNESNIEEDIIHLKENETPKNFHEKKYHSLGRYFSKQMLTRKRDNEKEDVVSSEKPLLPNKTTKSSQSQIYQRLQSTQQHAAKPDDNKTPKKKSSFHHSQIVGQVDTRKLTWQLNNTAESNKEDQSLTKQVTRKSYR